MDDRPKIEANLSLLIGIMKALFEMHDELNLIVNSNREELALIKAQQIEFQKRQRELLEHFQTVQREREREMVKARNQLILLFGLFELTAIASNFLSYPYSTLIQVLAIAITIIVMINRRLT